MLKVTVYNDNACSNYVLCPTCGTDVKITTANLFPDRCNICGDLLPDVDLMLTEDLTQMRLAYTVFDDIADLEEAAFKLYTDYSV